MQARPSPEEKTAYTYEPRTSFWVGRLLGKGREKPRK
jgi:hypothetical protein